MAPLGGIREFRQRGRTGGGMSGKERRNLCEPRHLSPDELHRETIGFIFTTSEAQSETGSTGRLPVWLRAGALLNVVHVL